MQEYSAKYFYYLNAVPQNPTMMQKTGNYFRFVVGTSDLATL